MTASTSECQVPRIGRLTPGHELGSNPGQLRAVCAVNNRSCTCITPHPLPHSYVGLLYIRNTNTNLIQQDGNISHQFITSQRGITHGAHAQYSSPKRHVSNCIFMPSDSPMREPIHNRGQPSIYFPIGDHVNVSWCCSHTNASGVISTSHIVASHITKLLLSFRQILQFRF